MAQRAVCILSWLVIRATDFLIGFSAQIVWGARESMVDRIAIRSDRLNH